MAMSSLWRNAGPLVIGRAISAVIGFTLPVVLARMLDATSYGTYKQVYLVANLALYSLQFGLAQSLFYFVPRAGTDAERRTFIGQTQTMLSLIGLLTFAGLLLGTPLIASKFSNAQLSGLTMPLALLAAALIASAPFEITMTSRGKPAWSAVVLVVSDVTRITAMLAAIELGYGVRGLIWAAAGAAVARWAFSLGLCGGVGHFRLTSDVMKKQLVYSLPFGVAVLLLNQQLQLHQVFVSAKMTPALFALYSVGCMQIPIVSLLYTPVSETLQVRLAALERTGETHKAGAVFAEAVDHLALIFLPLCALLIATARPGLHVLYAGRYDGAAAVMRIAVLSVAVASLPVDGVLKARARTGTLLWTYAIKLAITWPLLVVGYRMFGMEGAIGAHVTIELITKLALLAIISADLKLPMPQLLGGTAILRSVSVAVVAGAVAGLATMLIHRALWACAAAGVLCAAVMAAEFLHRRHQEQQRIAPSVARAA